MPLVTPTLKPTDQFLDKFNKIMYGDDAAGAVIGEGLIITNHWNPEITWSVDHCRDRIRLQRYMLDPVEDFLFDYGVCDTPHQFMVRYLEELKTFQSDVCVFFVHVPKNPGEQGGWRWHKWGPYVGYGQITCEYLADEQEFDDGVYTYAIYSVVEHNNSIQDIAT